MGSDVIVVAGATHRDGFLDEYEAQLAKADIPFHLEKLDPLPYGANSITMRRRIAYMRSMCEKFIDYERIAMTDAYDVLLAPNVTVGELMDKIPEDMVVSAERNLYPEPHLYPQFTSPSNWRFVNNGMLSGSPRKIIEWLKEAENTQDLDILDQAWFNRRRVDKTVNLWIDETTELFYVVSSTQEDGALKMKDGRLWNSVCNTHPCFIHFSGKCPDSKLRQMLADGEGELY